MSATVIPGLLELEFELLDVTTAATFPPKIWQSIVMVTDTAESMLVTDADALLRVTDEDTTLKIDYRSN